MSEKRLGWVDALKFLGIFAIYIGHLGDASGKAYQFVFLYHVQIFFFVAGFFATYKNNKDSVNFIYDRFKRLMLPYFAFGVITVIVKSIDKQFGVIEFFEAFTHILYGVRNDEYVGGMWFINCLFVICVFDYFSFKILKNKYLVLAVSLSSFIVSQYYLDKNPLSAPMWFMNIDSAMAYWWLMAAGRILFPVVCKINPHDTKFIFYPLIVILTLIASYTYFNESHFYFWFFQHALPSLPLTKWFWTLNFIIEPLTLVLFNVFIAMIVCKSTTINSVGRNSLNLCGIETSLKMIIPIVLTSIGLKLSIANTITACFYVSICLFVAHKITKWISHNYGSVFLIR
ncbi:acyltransferase family protein [Escherichia coli]|nr:acyltransferase family protein [Escherichia coli]EFH5887880.1 acyltransferase family protein [Escherichia coli]